jgi:single-strand DNA-binding protein
MNDTVTIMGFIGNDPSGSATNTGVPVVNFRVGSSQRRFDRSTQTWIDTGTNWYSVSAYRQLADHARASLRKGDPVIVTGRLKLREWDNGNGTRGSALDLDAEAIGHDLRWGSSAFVRANRPQSAQTTTSAAGETADQAVDQADEVDDEPHEIDERAQALLDRSWEPDRVAG